MKAFVLDDNEGTRAVVQTFLAYLVPGIEIITAGSIEEALQEFMKCGLSGHSFDLAILDCDLPDGYGTELMEPFKRAMPQCKILVSSAKVAGGRIDEDVIRRVAADGTLEKPYTLDRFRETLRSLGFP